MSFDEPHAEEERGLTDRGGRVALELPIVGSRGFALEQVHRPVGDDLIWHERTVVWTVVFEGPAVLAVLAFQSGIRIHPTGRLLGQP